MIVPLYGHFDERSEEKSPPWCVYATTKGMSHCVRHDGVEAGESRVARHFDERSEEKSPTWYTHAGMKGLSHVRST